jgi:hypothetical protein
VNWILDHLQVAVILVVVAVTLLGKLLEALKPNRPAGGSILETLGKMLGEDAGAATAPNPPGPAEPSPPPLRRAAVPPPLRYGTPPADVDATQAELERQRQMQERLRKIREAKAKPPVAPPPAPSVVKRQTISRGLKGQMRSSKELRRAMVIREILGPPVGLR